MANTYTQIPQHTIFVVKECENFITKQWRDSLHSYVSGVLKNENATSLSVGGWLDHVHFFSECLPQKIFLI